MKSAFPSERKKHAKKAITRNRPKTITCPDCDGSGVRIQADERGRPTIRLTCPRCQHTGVTDVLPVRRPGGVGRSAYNTLIRSELFWSKVDMSGGPDACWPWTGAYFKGRDGEEEYGRVYVHGSPKHDPRYRRAHLVSWELHFGMPFPDGMFGLHSCDHKYCCNWRHIRPGTQQENMRDAVERGQIKRGAESPAARNPESMGYTGKRAEYYRTVYGTDGPSERSIQRRGTYGQKAHRTEKTRKRGEWKLRDPEPS